MTLLRAQGFKYMYVTLCLFSSTLSALAHALDVFEHNDYDTK